MSDARSGFMAKLLSRSTLASQLWEKFDRDSQRQMPGYVLRRKAVRYLEGLALSSFYLRHATRLGKRARVRGAPYIENLGTLVIGDDFNFVSVWVQSHLATGHAGLLEIGNGVNINFGAAISAHEHVKIGDRVRLGPYAIVMDSDYHAAADRSSRPTEPIVIEDDVWIAGRVSILKGSRIGKGSVIAAGSVVSSVIPPGVIAGGVPARVLRRIAPDDASRLEREAEHEDRPAAAPAATATAHGAAEVGLDAVTDRVKAIVATAFAIEGGVELAWGPREIPKWDSLGQLQLTVSLEEAFAITISVEQLIEMTTVARICAIVRSCLAEGKATGVS